MCLTRSRSIALPGHPEGHNTRLAPMKNKEILLEMRDYPKPIIAAIKESAAIRAARGKS